MSHDLQPSRFCRPHVQPPRLPVLLAALLGLTSAFAQESSPALWVEGRVGASLTISSNGPLEPVSRSEQAVEISPGVQVVANGARVKGSLDYSLRAIAYARDTSSDNLRQSLNAKGSVELVDGRAYLDASGVISDETISAFGPVGGLSDTNRTETSSFRFSPYVKGPLTRFADYELRYAYASSNSQGSARSDSESQDVYLTLQGSGGGNLGWSVQAQSGSTDYSQDRKTRSDGLRLNLHYTVTPQLMLTAMAGTERNDVLTVQSESYSITGVGADWRPSPRSRLSIDLQDRYFGHSHRLQLEHRTGRTLWRLSDTRDVSNSPTQAATASLGTLAALLDAFYLTSVPDPVQRAQQVHAELLRLGLPGNTEVFQSFLSSSATLARTQILSAILQGRRTVVTATLSRSRTSRLQSAISLGDDFDNSSYVLQHGLSLAVAHRLTPQTSASADWSFQRNEGSQAGQRTSTHSLSLRVNTQLAPRTSGSVQLRRSVQSSSTSPYGETAISGTVNHRF